MIDFHAVMQRVKQILSLHYKKEKILDRDIADALELDPQYFAVIKRRRKIPYEAIAYFCKRYNISMNWVLLEQNSPNLT
ncbi:hypothetical protein ACLHDG_13055 [Sulfurovum sp. CS9]|uniref:hypothetical protein n=1 Tax=Sulfurovum sp. CS9 TaxID=3391146 RepID=UPI0039EA8B02